MADQPFHHGHLRAVLLDQAELTLRDDGVNGLSLRDLARRAGVSHGAPRSHFPDRQALLDALAERGFRRLTTDVAAAVTASPDGFADRMRAVARAYVRFAATDSALLELMFEAKASDPPEAVQNAAADYFTYVGALVDTALAAGQVGTTDPFRTKLLFAATLQGIASLLVSRRITPDQSNTLIDDATDLLAAPRLST